MGPSFQRFGWFAGAAVLTLVLCSASAFADLAASPPEGASPVPAASAPRQWLSPIEIDGHKVPVPVALQMLKNALNRPWSSSPQDKDVMVCRMPTVTGTHFSKLRCQTNGEHQKEHEAFERNALMGQITGEDVGFENPQLVNPGAVRKLLSKLPAANSSYTLRVKDHGKVVARYVFHKGHLVKTWHRAMPAAKAGKTHNH